MYTNTANIVYLRAWKALSIRSVCLSVCPSVSLSVLTTNKRVCAQPNQGASFATDPTSNPPVSRPTTHSGSAPARNTTRNAHGRLHYLIVRATQTKQTNPNQIRCTSNHSDNANEVEPGYEMLMLATSIDDWQHTRTRSTDSPPAAVAPSSGRQRQPVSFSARSTPSGGGESNSLARHEIAINRATR